jgi:CRISPR-associated protein Cas1
MGLEGTAGRLYFDCLSKLMPEGFHFDGRSRQPAKDAFNATLNYAYGVLYSHTERAAILAGLDPGIGFLHADTYGKPSLVFDLIEPVRVLADRTVVLLFTGRRAQTTFFEAIPGGVGLSKDGRAALISLLNERLKKAVRYPVRGRPGRFRNLKQRDVIRHEAHAVANALLDRNDALTVVQTRDLFAEGTGPSPSELEEIEEEPGEPAREVGSEGEDEPC